MRPEESPGSSADEHKPSKQPDVQESPPPYEPDLELITYLEKRRASDTD